MCWIKTNILNHQETQYATGFGLAFLSYIQFYYICQTGEIFEVKSKNFEQIALFENLIKHTIFHLFTKIFILIKFLWFFSNALINEKIYDFNIKIVAFEPNYSYEMKTTTYIKVDFMGLFVV